MTTHPFSNVHRSRSVLANINRREKSVFGCRHLVSSMRWHCLQLSSANSQCIDNLTEISFLNWHCWRGRATSVFLFCFLFPSSTKRKLTSPPLLNLNVRIRQFKLVRCTHWEAVPPVHVTRMKTEVSMYLVSLFYLFIAKN